MISLPLNELKLIAKSRSINECKEKSEEDLITLSPPHYHQDVKKIIFVVSLTFLCC